MNNSLAMRLMFLEIAVLHMKILAGGRKKERLILINEDFLSRGPKAPWQEFQAWEAMALVKCLTSRLKLEICFCTSVLIGLVLIIMNIPRARE